MELWQALGRFFTLFSIDSFRSFQLLIDAYDQRSNGIQIAEILFYFKIASSFNGIHRFSHCIIENLWRVEIFKFRNRMKVIRSFFAATFKCGAHLCLCAHRKMHICRANKKRNQRMKSKMIFLSFFIRQPVYGTETIAFADAEDQFHLIRSFRIQISVFFFYLSPKRRAWINNARVLMRRTQTHTQTNLHLIVRKNIIVIDERNQKIQIFVLFLLSTEICEMFN